VTGKDREKKNPEMAGSGQERGKEAHQRPRERRTYHSICRRQQGEESERDWKWERPAEKWGRSSKQWKQIYGEAHRNKKEIERGAGREV
jgi:hypothetical protein